MTFCTHKHALTDETNMSTLQCTGKNMNAVFAWTILKLCVCTRWVDFIYESVQIAI
jgi:hypothetical protein